MTTTQPRSSQSSRRIDSKIRSIYIDGIRSMSRFISSFIENQNKYLFTWRVIFLLLFVNVLFAYFAFKHYSKSLFFHDVTIGTIISYSSVFILLFAAIFYIILILTTLIIRFKESMIIVLLEKCWQWIKTNFLTIVFAFAFVLVFLFYENKIVDISFSFLRIITTSKFGIVLLWGLWAGGLAAIIYSILKTATNSTLSDGRTFFLSLILCSLFAYCATKYPWEMVDPNKVNPEMLDPEKVNPIIGYEWAFLFLFIQYAFCFLILPFIQYFRVALKRKNYIQSSKSTQTGKYLIDSPITSIHEDELFFDNHVRTLKKRIDEIPNTNSHSIAITGGWGTGKTSFLNLLQQKLITENRYEIMWFNPLKSSKSGNIQNDFFDVLENTLSKYKMGFGRRIKYYKELIGAIDNKYISFLVKLGNIQLEEEKKRINDIIKMVPKKIIIIIDDVDRLKSDEIIQVFKLVGFNAEFDNVVFLLALDKMNVIKALSCDYNYPDKFFEMEFPLPNNYRYFTRRYLKNTMEKLVPEIPMPFLDDQTISAYTTYCINNMRDANRFLNNFVDRVKMVNKKLDVRSYYLLSLIQYKDLHYMKKSRQRNPFWNSKRFLE